MKNSIPCHYHSIYGLDGERRWRRAAAGGGGDRRLLVLYALPLTRACSALRLPGWVAVLTMSLLIHSLTLTSPTALFFSLPLRQGRHLAGSIVVSGGISDDAPFYSIPATLPRMRGRLILRAAAPILSSGGAVYSGVPGRSAWGEQRYTCPAR